MVVAVALALTVLPQAPTQAPPQAPPQAPSQTRVRSWTVAPEGGLVWKGEPYRPFGARVPGDPEAIRALRARGVNDFIVELPVAGDWAPALAALSGARAIVAINSAAAMADGYSVAPQSFRVDGITTDAPIAVPLPGARAAFVVVAAKRDGSLVWSGEAQVRDGLATFKPKVITGAEHVALIYPLGPSLHTEDLWEGLDAQRDALLARLRSADLSAVRAILDPLGAMTSERDRSLDVIPVSPLFRTELAEYLETTYRNLRAAMQAWALSANDVENFDGLARLVPLWNAGRGVDYILDPASGRTFRVDRGRSAAWRDIGVVISRARARRSKSIVAAIRRSTGLPILRTWTGWNGDIETNAAGYDGLGFVADAGGSAEITASAARPLGTVLRWGTPPLLVATDFSRPITAAESPTVADDLARLGVSAAFVGLDRMPATPLPPYPADLSAPRAFYFPENALNPAFPQRLGAALWLPAPTAGGRLELGPSFAAYRDESGGGRFALWSLRGRKRAILLTRSPKTVRLTPADGVDPNARIVKDGIEVDVPETPLFIEGVASLPVPAPALDELATELEGLQRLAAERKRDIGDDTYPVGRLADLVKGDPGVAVATLARVIRRVRVRLGPYVWLEAESDRRNTFGETVTDGSASGGGALALDSAIPADAPNVIEWNVPARGEGEADVWIALRASEANRKALSVRVNGQVLFVTDSGLAPYGSGYRWYRLGTTRLTGAQNEISVQIRPRLGDEITVDALLIAPPGIVPDGVTVPAFALPPPPPKGKRP